MWMPKFLKKRIAKYKTERYLSRLKYAMVRLEKPFHDDIDPRDREFRLEAVKWLFFYYKGDSDIIAEGPPDLKLEKVLAKPTRDVTLRDHVFAKVLYYWTKHKLVEGL